MPKPFWGDLEDVCWEDPVIASRWGLVFCQLGEFAVKPFYWCVCLLEKSPGWRIYAATPSGSKPSPPSPGRTERMSPLEAYLAREEEESEATAPAPLSYNDSCEALLAGVAGDVHRWGEGVLDGLTAEQIRQQQGWYGKRARRAKRGWREYCNRAEASSWQAVNDQPESRLSDASRTIKRRTFWDREAKVRRRYYEHKPVGPESAPASEPQDARKPKARASAGLSRIRRRTEMRRSHKGGGKHASPLKSAASQIFIRLVFSGLGGFSG